MSGFRKAAQIGDPEQGGVAVYFEEIAQTPDDEGNVRPEWGCPHCGERSIEALVLHDDGERVHCATCGHEYPLP
jgi:ribosomal protein S27AE